MVAMELTPPSPETMTALDPLCTLAGMVVIADDGPLSNAVLTTDQLCSPLSNPLFSRLPHSASAATVRDFVAVSPPLTEVAVIVTVPAAMPLTSPVVSTVAIELLDEVQVTFLLLAFAGVKLTFSRKVSGTFTLVAPESMLIAVGVTELTVTVSCPATPPTAVAVMMAVHAPIPVTTPAALTFAFVVSDDTHV